MPLTREDIRASVERAGDEHWRALIAHHEEPYPRPTPTPGDVCRAEAARLNELGILTSPGAVLLESRVTRIGEEVELVHRYRPTADADPVDTRPFRNYAPDPA